MKRKTREESLLNRIQKLQRDLYDYASKKEYMAHKCSNIEKKEKLLSMAEHITNAGFEMDVSQSEMEDAINILQNE